MTTPAPNRAQPVGVFNALDIAEFINLCNTGCP